MATIRIDKKTKIEAYLETHASYEDDIAQILGLNSVKLAVIESLLDILQSDGDRTNIAPLLDDELADPGPISRENAVREAFARQVASGELDEAFENSIPQWTQDHERLRTTLDGILGAVEPRHADAAPDEISDYMAVEFSKAIIEGLKTIIAEDPILVLPNEVRAALGYTLKPDIKVPLHVFADECDEEDASPLFVLVTHPKSGGDLETICGRDLADSPNLQAAMRKACENASLRFYYTDGNDGLEDDYLREITQAFFEGGTLEAFSDAIAEKSKPYRERFYTQLVGDEVQLDGLHDALMVKLARVLPKESASELRSAIHGVLLPMAREMVEEGDTSTPLDMIPERTSVEVCMVPDLGELDTEQVSLNFCSQMVRNGEVVPDEALARFLRLINLSSKDLMAAAAAAPGQCGVICGSSLGKMPDASKFEDGKEDYAYRQSVEQAQAWKKFSVKADPTRPALLTAHQAMEILENARGTSVVPFVGMQVTLLPFIKAMAAAGEGASIQIQAEDKGSPVVGLHSFWSGYGHYTHLKEPVVLSAKPGDWMATGGAGQNGLKGTYSLILSRLQAHVSVVEPTPDAKPRTSKVAPTP